MSNRITLSRWLIVLMATTIAIFMFLTLYLYRGFAPTLRFDGDIRTSKVAASHDGAFLAVTAYVQNVDGNRGDVLRLIDLKTRAFADFDIGSEPAGAVATSPDNRLLAIARGSHHVQLWDLTTHTKVRTSLVDGNDFLVFDPSGRYVYAAERLGNGVVDRVDVNTGVAESVFGPDSKIHVDRHQYGGRIWAIDVLPGGKELFVAMPLGAVVWDLHAASERSFVSTEKFTSSFAIHPDGMRVAMTYGAGAALVNIRTGRQIAQLRCDSSRIRSLKLTQVAFSSDGQLLAGSLCGGLGVPSYIAVWRLENCENPIIFWCHKSETIALLFVPGTHRLVSGGHGGTICVWDVDEAE